MCGWWEAELSNENTKERVQKISQQAKGDKEKLTRVLDARYAEVLRLRGLLEKAGVDPGPLEEEEEEELSLEELAEMAEGGEGGSLANELGADWNQ